MEPFIFLGVPAYGGIDPMALDGLSCAAQKYRWHRHVESTSILTHTFNMLWATCLNYRKQHGFTHFAMHHADIQSPPDWIDTLYDEMNRVDADVLGVVVPIKDGRGLTSTGVRDESGRIRRFTMKELARMPETFGAEAVAPGEALMLNTGLWICRLGSWVDDFPGFSTLSALATGEDGTKTAQVLSEDWNWSSWLAEQPLRVLLTRKVRVTHYGRAGFESWGEWGTLETDVGDGPEPREKKRRKAQLSKAS